MGNDRITLVGQSILISDGVKPGLPLEMLKQIQIETKRLLVITSSQLHPKQIPLRAEC